HQNHDQCDEMLETGHSYDSVNEWVLSSGQIVNQLPTSDFYSDAFWNDCNSMIQPYEGEWFAIHCDPKASNPTAWFDVCDYDASSGTAEITHLNSLDAKWAKWYAFGESGYYLGTYITPAIAGDTIYYTTPSAVFALKDQQIVWLFNLDEEQQTIGYIYGMNKEGNALHYYVSPTPNGEPQEYIYELFEEPEETTATTTTTTPETTTITTTTTTPETTTTTTTTTTPETTTTTTTTTTPETTTTTTTSETTTASETEIVTEEPSESEIVPVYGDMNGDDELTVDDVIMLQKYLLNQETLSETQFFLADITNDGDVNIYDFIALKQTIFNQA
ncbi:MAG: dockerin type I repeat-containing protein, partial [Oscillospiraceae bacterium]|nr:dockerin type I repeat-containing protein [Oscillospiraceae bacterium]